LEIKIFFDSIDEQDYDHITDSNSLFRNIEYFGEKLPNWRKADIALIGIVENRGSLVNTSAAKAAEKIRRQLYQLKKGAKNYKIVDLGNLRNGDHAEATQLRLKEVCQALLEHKVLPIIFGGTHDIDYGQYMAYEHYDKLISVLNVDAFLDMENDKSLGLSRHHSHQIMMHQPNYLFNYTNLAYQSYLADQQMLDTLEKLSFENYRLGQVQEKIEEMEPVVRDADMLSFDISAIKMQDAPGNAQSQPFGLTGQEACQLAWYAGQSDKLTSAGFYEYNPEDDFRTQTAQVVATMMWYLIEGFYHRKLELEFNTDNYYRYLVSLPDDQQELIFYKSKQSEKWWMEVPFPISKSKYTRSSIVPCSYTDYLIAGQGEIPDRWLHVHTKLI
jgi:formiminoglutamase